MKRPSPRTVISIGCVASVLAVLTIWANPSILTKCNVPDCDGGPWAHTPPGYMLKAPFPGSLMPTKESILPGFVKDPYAIYTKDNYHENYVRSSSENLRFSETNDNNPSQTYKRKIAEEDKFAEGKSVIRNPFTHLNSPGVTYTWNHSDGTATYILIWNDSGKILEIRFGNARTAEYKAQVMMDILKTMQRAP